MRRFDQWCQWFIAVMTLCLLVWTASLGVIQRQGQRGPLASIEAVAQVVIVGVLLRRRRNLGTAQFRWLAATIVLVDAAFLTVAAKWRHSTISEGLAGEIVLCYISVAAALACTAVWISAGDLGVRKTLMKDAVAPCALALICLYGVWNQRDFLIRHYSPIFCDEGPSMRDCSRQLSDIISTWATGVMVAFFVLNVSLGLVKALLEAVVIYLNHRDQTRVAPQSEISSGKE